ncbi:hypothetical protein VKT23_016653 [Stygiomarasmius scandens]|uniref:Uncharacterized protein n=1 Tax=Marasmiellus scandens TaxID=2682957 RepID=A0ABR1IXI6_9AGAR
MVRTCAQGPPTNSAGPPARRTRSKTTKKPQSSLTKPTKPTKKRTTKQKVLYVEVPRISLGLGPSASSAPHREQASENGRQKQCMSLDYFFKFRRGDDILSVSPSKSVSPQRMQAAVRPATPYASPCSSHSSVTSSTPTPHDLDTIPTIPAEQKEKLGIQGVTYADLDHEDLETRQKMSNTQFPSPVDERNDAGAYDDDLEWGDVRSVWDRLPPLVKLRPTLKGNLHLHPCHLPITFVPGPLNPETATPTLHSLIQSPQLRNKKP